MSVQILKKQANPAQELRDVLRSLGVYPLNFAYETRQKATIWLDSVQVKQIETILSFVCQASCLAAFVSAVIIYRNFDSSGSVRLPLVWALAASASLTLACQRIHLKPTVEYKVETLEYYIQRPDILPLPYNVCVVVNAITERCKVDFKVLSVKIEGRENINFLFVWNETYGYLVAKWKGGRC